MKAAGVCATEPLGQCTGHESSEFSPMGAVIHRPDCLQTGSEAQNRFLSHCGVFGPHNLSKMSSQFGCFSESHCENFVMYNVVKCCRFC